MTSLIAAQLFYDGRPEGRPMYGRFREDAIASCIELKEAIQCECGDAAGVIFPDAAGWQVRVISTYSEEVEHDQD